MPTPRIDTLILVCCHAIWIGSPESVAFGPSNVENGWLISPFQTGETPTFISHIQTGINTLLANPTAILVFSGGRTKPQLTRLTEAGTYMDFLINTQPAVFHNNLDRLTSESSATDSFQNVLFSLLNWPRFVHECYNHRAGLLPASRAVAFDIPLSPRKLIVIGHEFKRARFEKLHLPVLRYPTEASRFEYIGIDPLFSEQKMREIREGMRGVGLRVDAGGDGGFYWGLEEEVAGIGGEEWETREQFEKIVKFVEGTEKDFPEKAPWS